MRTLASITDQALDSLGSSLPRLAGAIGVLVVGLILGWLIGRIVASVLRRAGVDGLAERWQLDDVLARVGLGRTFSGAIGKIVQLIIWLIVIFAVVPKLGFDALEPALNEVLLFVPRLIVAVVLLVVGMVVGRFVGERVDRMARQMDLAGPIGTIVSALIVGAFGLIAAAQIGVPTTVLIVAFGVAVGALALTATLAFGLGARDVARQVTAGRYVSESFEVGQQISVGQVSGTIERLERSAASVRRDDGSLARLPNHLLLESVVTVHESTGEPS